MPMWQVWRNWPDKSPGVPRAVRAPWVTPPSESGGPGWAQDRPPPALHPCLESAGFPLSTPPLLQELPLNWRPAPLGLGLELPGMSWAGQSSSLAFDRFVWLTSVRELCAFMGFVCHGGDPQGCTDDAPTPPQPTLRLPTGSFPPSEGLCLNLPSSIHTLILAHTTPCAPRLAP